MNDKKRVLAILQAGKVITSWDAFQLFGCTRLAAVICRLRQEGHDIVTVMCYDRDRHGEPCRFAKYMLRDTFERICCGTATA